MKQLIKKNIDPKVISEITLGKDASIDLLYGCFRINNPRGDAFAPQREVELLARSGKNVRVTVPPAMKVELPADQKVVNTDLFRLEEIGRHGDSMHLLAMRAGFNQTAEDIRRMIKLDKHGSFVAKVTGAGFDIP